MAARPKASEKPAESTTTDAKQAADDAAQDAEAARNIKAKEVEEASKALNEALADAAPKDGEQPIPAAAPVAAPEAEKPKAKRTPLSLSEIRGEVKDGEKIYIGVEIWDGKNKGGTQNAPFVVPKNWVIAGPASRPTNVHAINTDLPKTTLCRLPTNWTSGIAYYDDDKLLTCEPCARRLIATKKLTQADHDKRKVEAQKARDSALQALAARLEAEKKKKEAAPAVQAPTVETPAEAPKEEAPKAAPESDVKPDPKPTRTRRQSKAAK